MGAIDKDGDAGNYYFPDITFAETFILQSARFAIFISDMFHPEVCRVYRMTSRFKSDRGNSAVHDVARGRCEE